MLPLWVEEARACESYPTKDIPKKYIYDAFSTIYLFYCCCFFHFFGTSEEMLGIVLTNMKCLPLLAFRGHVVNAIFLKYSKEGRLSSSDAGIWNISSDIYDETKHYQVQPEYRLFQNLFKHLRWIVFA